MFELDEVIMLLDSLAIRFEIEASGKGIDAWETEDVRHKCALLGENHGLMRAHEIVLGLLAEIKSTALSSKEIKAASGKYLLAALIS